MSETEEHVDLHGSPRLHLRRRRNAGPPVLYVHGATFPCALAVGYRFEDGRSWEDALVEAGFEAWSLDFAGYGGSEWPRTEKLFGRAEDAARQIARAIDRIRKARAGARVSVVAHSWGGIPAAMFAARTPEALSSLVLFAPILRRQDLVAAPPTTAAWRFISVEAQRTRFEQDTPRGLPCVLAEPDLRRWGDIWMATDANASARSEPAVAVPTGPQFDVAAMWAGATFYDAADITAPTLVVRGAWDSLCTDADVARFVAASRGRRRRDVCLPEGGHLMHLETGRHRLWRAVNEFLSEETK